MHLLLCTLLDVCGVVQSLVFPHLHLSLQGSTAAAGSYYTQPARRLCLIGKPPPLWRNNWCSSPGCCRIRRQIFECTLHEFVAGNGRLRTFVHLLCVLSLLPVSSLCPHCAPQKRRPAGESHTHFIHPVLSQSILTLYIHVLHCGFWDSCKLDQTLKRTHTHTCYNNKGIFCICRWNLLHSQCTRRSGVCPGENFRPVESKTTHTTKCVQQMCCGLVVYLSGQRGGVSISTRLSLHICEQATSAE